MFCTECWGVAAKFLLLKLVSVFHKNFFAKIIIEIESFSQNLNCITLRQNKHDKLISCIAATVIKKKKKKKNITKTVEIRA